MSHALLNFASLLVLVVSTQPASGPQAIREALDGLTAPDPLIRAAARDALMQLSRDDLPALRDAVARRAPVGAALRSAVHEVVTHVYLVGQHNFKGAPPGQLGVRVVNDGGSPVVLNCRPGFDSLRVLQDGDTIVGIAVPRGPAKQLSATQPIGDYPSLTEALSRVDVGDRVIVRVIRNGQTLEFPMRVAPFSPMPIDGPEERIVQAENYWTQSWEPLLRASPTPSTAPASGDGPSTRP